MKRILTAITVITLLMLLAACGKENDNNDPIDLNDDSWMDEEVTLYYATWNLIPEDSDLFMGEKIEHLMIEEFERRYPNINVEIIYVGNDLNWTSNFTAKIGAGEQVPDVFSVMDADIFINSEVLYDFSGYWDNDPDADLVMDSLKDVGLYTKGDVTRRLVAPGTLSPYATFVFKTLADKNGVAMPSYDWDFDEYKAFATSVTNEPEGEWGLEVCNWEMSYPAMMNPSYNYWTWDGDSFNFDDPLFLQGIQAEKDAIAAGYCKGGWPSDAAERAAEKAEYYGIPDLWPPSVGKIGIHVQPSWDMGWFGPQLSDNDVVYDIYPGPNGRTRAALNVSGMSSITEHPRQAYELMKWMSFSEDGLRYKYGIAWHDERLATTSSGWDFPGIISDRVWNALPYGAYAPGWVSPEFIQSLNNGIIFPQKAFIGFWESHTVINTYMAEFETRNPADLVVDMTNEANQAVADAWATLNLR
jgi:multiple sugar transport system substrate-binding protein